MKQNLPKEFKTPDNNDTNETNNKNGNEIRLSEVANSNLPEILSNPGAKT